MRIGEAIKELQARNRVLEQILGALSNEEVSEIIKRLKHRPAYTYVYTFMLITTLLTTLATNHLYTLNHVAIAFAFCLCSRVLLQGH